MHRKNLLAELYSSTNEVETNRKLIELADRNSSERLDAQEYRVQRRPILTQFLAYECTVMGETI